MLHKIFWSAFILIGCSLMGGLLVKLFSSKHEQTDLVYATVDGTSLTLDIDYPTVGKAPYPVVLFIPPTGDWTYAFKQFKQFRMVLDTANAHGYAVALPHFRNFDKHRFPAVIEDLKAAVRWLRAQGSSYALRTERIGVAGVSAGGYAACMLGTTDPKDGFEGNEGNPDYSSRVQAIVSFGAALDLEHKIWDENVETQLLKPFLGTTFEENPALYKKASPGVYAGPDDPPFLLFHSSKDKKVPFQHARSFEERLRQVGVSIQVVEIDSTQHVGDGAELQMAIEQGLDFFDQHIR